jgi:hypothetical protein
MRHNLVRKKGHRKKVNIPRIDIIYIRSVRICGTIEDQIYVVLYYKLCSSSKRVTGYICKYLPEGIHI